MDLSGNVTVGDDFNTRINIGDIFITRIGTLIRNCNNRLKSVSLYACRIGDVGMKRLSDGLVHNISVEKINVSQNDNVNYEGWKAFSLMLKVNKGVKEVDCSSCCLVGSKMEVLAAGLEQNSTVESIRLHYNLFDGVQGALALKRMVRTNCSIKIINLYSCELSSASITSIVEGLIENKKSSIEDINLFGNRIDEDCAKVIGMLFKSVDCSIKVFNANNSMAPVAMKIIAEGLEDNSSVEEIHLCHNWTFDEKTNDEAMISIANTLKKNNTLRVINLMHSLVYRSDVSVKAVKYLIECIGNNSTIRCISSHGMPLENNDVMVMFYKLLKMNSNLRKFHIRLGENIKNNDEVKKELVERIKQNYNIEEIWASSGGMFAYGTRTDSYKREIDFYLERNRRGLGRCLIDEADKRREANQTNSTDKSHTPASLWPFILSKLGSNVICSNNCTQDSRPGGSLRITEASLLYYMIRERPLLFNSSNACIDDNKPNDNGHKQKRQRLEE